MKTWLRGCFLIAGMAMVCLPMSAHHGNAAFSDKVTEFKNVTVTKFAWANPHCLVEFDAKDDKGKVVNWSAESGSPEALRLTGWNKNSLRPGDVISIYVHTAKTGAPAGRLTKVVLADGTTLGDTQGNAVPPISRGGGGNGDY
jgi:Family of unknown function (DUF6152)